MQPAVGSDWCYWEEASSRRGRRGARAFRGTPKLPGSMKNSRKTVGSCMQTQPQSSAGSLFPEQPMSLHPNQMLALHNACSPAEPPPLGAPVSAFGRFAATSNPTILPRLTRVDERRDAALALASRADPRRNLSRTLNMGFCECWDWLAEPRRQ